MIEFEWWWMFFLLPLPLIIWRILPPGEEIQDPALVVPFVDDFSEFTGTSVSTDRGKLPLVLAVLLWVLFITAGARPVWLGEPIELQVSGREMLLAIDLSGSMAYEDFQLGNKQVSRLQATKKVAGEFIQRRVGDRVGLLLFGTRPYLQAPLTFDRSTVQTLLNEAAIGLAGKETAIGDAIGLGVKRLRERPESMRVMILLTDGANTTGQVEPEKAAAYAAQEHITIHTIGVGADNMVVQSFFGRRTVNPSRDLDEETLKMIADTTGGKYFRARDTEELESIYQIIDELEPITAGDQYFRPKTPLYWWPLTAALLLIPFLFIARGRR